MVAAVILVITVAAAVWFSNQTRTDNPAPDVTIEFETGEADPGTETTGAP